jgi:ABC-2 type transport system ATP-binding protein
MDAVTVSDLVVERGRRRVLSGLSFAVPAGQVTGLLGPSGSGKTTLMRAIVGVQRIAAGDVRVLGRPAGSARLRARMGYMTQAPSVYGDLTVRENLRFFARALGLPEAKVDAAIDAVAVPARAGQLVRDLSGGERARVSLAAVLLGEPELLVLDEPTSALDVTVQARILALIKRLRDERSLSYLLISHNLAVVDQLCEQCIVLRDGEVVERGATAQVLDDPRHPYTQELRATVPEIPAPTAVRRLERPS